MFPPFSFLLKMRTLAICLTAVLLLYFCFGLPIFEGKGKPVAPFNPYSYGRSGWLNDMIEWIKAMEQDRQQRQHAWGEAVKRGDAVVVRVSARRGYSRFPGPPRLEFETWEEWEQNKGKRGYQLTDGSRMANMTLNSWPPGQKLSD